MWFLTQEGIDRYNGKQYTHYSLTANGKLLNFFPNLNTLQTDTAGVVWEIGKTGHLFRYNSLQDKFELVCDFASKDKRNHIYCKIYEQPIFFGIQPQDLLCKTESWPIRNNQASGTG